MKGRYGPDHLGIALIILSFVFVIAFAITRLSILTYIAYAIIALVIYRMFSYNLRRRRAENDRFIRYWWPIKTKIKRLLRRIAAKIKKIFKRKK